MLILISLVKSISSTVTIEMNPILTETVSLTSSPSPSSTWLVLSLEVLDERMNVERIRETCCLMCEERRTERERPGRVIESSLKAEDVTRIEAERVSFSV
jgi:hypothetical protein